jgi:hypothetical protein
MADMSWWDRLAPFSQEFLLGKRRQRISWGIYEDLVQKGAPLIQADPSKSVFTLSDDVWDEIERRAK